MNDARRFLQEIVKNDTLRDSLNKAQSRKDIEVILKKIPYEFVCFEIDDAYRSLLLNCQSEEQAMLIKEVKNWWDLLLFITPESASPPYPLHKECKGGHDGE
jgi:hypothetical protein